MDTATGRLTFTGEGGEGPVFPLVFAPDGATVLGGYNRGVVGRDLFGVQRRVGPARRFDSLTCLAVSPDGRTLAGGGGAATIRLWRAGAPDFDELPGHPGGLLTVAFSADGRTLASGGKDQLDPRLGSRLRPGTQALRRPPRLDAGAELFAGRQASRLGRQRRRGPPVGRADRPRIGRVHGPPRRRQLRRLHAGRPEPRLGRRRFVGADLGRGRRAARPRPGAVTFRREQLENFWDRLGGDGPDAYLAIQYLAQAPEQAVPLLAARVRPVEMRRIERLLRDLDSDDFETRERASAELAALGASADRTLREALKAKPISAEKRRRLRELLATLETGEPAPESLRAVRRHRGAGDDRYRRGAANSRGPGERGQGF